MKKFIETALYSKVSYWIVIPIISIIVALIYFVDANSFAQNALVIYIIQSLFMTLGIWFGCNIIVVYLWKKYPWEFKPLTHLFLEIFAIIIYTNVFSFVIFYLFRKLNLVIDPSYKIDFMSDIVLTNLITLFITAIHEAIFFYRQWKYNFSKSIQLEKENIEAQYTVLKNQLNPHFLFNSLNTLSSIVYEHTEAHEYVNNLSEFLRYILKQRNVDLVSVSEEIEMIESYIAIQKSRFANNLQVTIEIPQEYYSLKIPPLVVQGVVENCIKHNVVSAEKPLRIHMYVGKNMLVVSNNLQKKRQVESIGSGLQTTKHRYSFFTTDELKVVENDTHFIVYLPLIYK